MSYCSVPGCVYKTYSLLQLEHVSFHKMPKENAKEWINAIGFKKDAVPKKVSVCSLHLEPKCYSLHNACYSLDDAYRTFCDSISQPLTKKRYLNKGSVPTLHLPPKTGCVAAHILQKEQALGQQRQYSTQQFDKFLKDNVLKSLGYCKKQKQQQQKQQDNLHQHMRTSTQKYAKTQSNDLSFNKQYLDEFANVSPRQASLRERMISLVNREKSEQKSLFERDESIEQNYHDKKQELNKQQLTAQPCYETECCKISKLKGKFEKSRRKLEGYQCDICGYKALFHSRKKFTCEYILEKNHLNVQNVTILVYEKLTLNHTCENTLVKNHLNVLNVTILVYEKLTLNHTLENTLVKNHLNVLNATILVYIKVP